MAEVIHIPARQAGSVPLSKGDRVSIIDVAGHQGADCLAITPDGTSTSSPQETRARLGRLFPKVGQSIYSDLGVPFLTLTADTSPGPHGLLVPPCDPTMYRLRGAGLAHGSCFDNLHQTLARYGISPWTDTGVDRSIPKLNPSRDGRDSNRPESAGLEIA